MPTKIEWTDESWNPIVGCTKISEGCDRCYAEKMAARLAAMYSKNKDRIGLAKYFYTTTNGKWDGTTFIGDITDPLKWKKPRKVFVCSMGDLFHGDILFERIDSVFSVMSDCDQHIYQVLTKRPQRVLDFFSWKWEQTKHLAPDIDFIPWSPKDNVWIGVSIENQEQLKKRGDLLKKIPAAISFISFEPLLGPVHIDKELCNIVDWVICGGETGHNARPMHPDWVRSIRDQCEEYDIPFFFKSWGEYRPFEINMQPPICKDVNYSKKYYSIGTKFIDPYRLNKGKFDGFKWMDFPEELEIDNCMFLHTRKKHSGCMIDGKEYKEFPKTNWI